jgi:hypothetical protein
MALRASIPSTKLVNNDYTEFQVEVYNGTSLVKIANLRYSQFCELHENLSRSTNASFKVPELPPKKYFGRTNPSFVRERQQKLEVFLNGVINGINSDVPKAKTLLTYLSRFLGTTPETLSNRVPPAAGAPGNGATATAAAENHSVLRASESQVTAGGFDQGGLSSVEQVGILHAEAARCTCCCSRHR